MPERLTCFVQFPHPGQEHRTKQAQMGWNTDAHRRKFLVARGDYVDGSGRRGSGRLAFWAEWEPPSRIARRWSRSGRLPTHQHVPFWYVPTQSEQAQLQNTDPWVWGRCFLYSNCRQMVLHPRPRPAAMQRLARASVICFGSTLDGEFGVDAVFVVDSSQEWSPGSLPTDLDAAFEGCTIAPTVARQRGRPARYTLYRGATPRRPVEGMFSFVPARPDSEDPRFERPRIRLDGCINPQSRQSPRGATRAVSLATLRERWDVVRQQVLDAGLLLAVQLETPEGQRDQPRSSGGLGKC